MKIKQRVDLKSNKKERKKKERKKERKKTVIDGKTEQKCI